VTHAGDDLSPVADRGQYGAQQPDLSRHPWWSATRRCPLITRVSLPCRPVVRDLLRRVEIERAVRPNGVIIAVDTRRTARL